MDIKTDHRIRVTKEILKGVIIKLLKDKPIKDITVKEICIDSEINRTTFYAYYKDVYDLLEQIETDIFNELNSLLKMTETNINYLSNNIYNELFDLTVKHSDMLYILLVKNADPKFVEKITLLGQNTFITIYKNSNINLTLDKLNYFYVSVLNSFIGILTLWLRNGMPGSATEMAILTKRIITKGLNFIT